MNEALVQGVETARAVLTTTPQGQAADAQFVKWLMDHQKEAGVFTTVSGLVEQLSDNPAARLTAQEIAQRVQQAQQQRTAPGGERRRLSRLERLEPEFSMINSKHPERPVRGPRVWTRKRPRGSSAGRRTSCRCWRGLGI